jgi:hypothetical protein
MMYALTALGMLGLGAFGVLAEYLLDVRAGRRPGGHL